MSGPVELLSLSYHLASIEDLEPVYDLYMDESSNPFLTYDVMEMGAFKSIYTELLVTKTLYVAVLENGVAGSYRLIQKAHRESDTLYLGGFVVKSAYKGKGLGTKILLHIKEEAVIKGMKRIELTVDLYNTPAINLYKKVGFEIEGHIRMGYKLSSSHNYLDEYLMGLIL